MMNPIVGKLQKRLSSINLFDKIGSVVEVQIQGKKRFPVCLDKDCILKNESCTDAYISFIPNSHDLAMCYFEYVSEVGINTHSRQAKLKLVCYWNSSKIESDASCIVQNVTQVIESVNNKISDTISINGNCRVTSIAKDAAIFQKYDYDEANTQYTKHPFDFRAFDIEFVYRIDFSKIKQIVLKTNE